MSNHITKKEEILKKFEEMVNIVNRKGGVQIASWEWLNIALDTYAEAVREEAYKEGVSQGYYTVRQHLLQTKWNAETVLKNFDEWYLQSQKKG